MQWVTAQKRKRAPMSAASKEKERARNRYRSCLISFRCVAELPCVLSSTMCAFDETILTKTLILIFELGNAYSCPAEG